MTFSVLEWMVSKSLDLSLTKSFAAFNNLQTRLNKTVDEWAKKLPANEGLISVAMYLNVNDNSENDTSLRAVCELLEKSRLPDNELLSAALMEKWFECRSNGADQPFFLITKAKAKNHINDLAGVILSILVQENDLFNNFVHAQLTHLRTENKKINSSLQFLEQLIRQNQQSRNHTNKVFRPIPDCRIPVLEDHEMRKALLGVFLKISLFQSFSDTKYYKFACLMTYSTNAFYEGDDDLAGLTLYTGEIDFLSNLTNLVDIYLQDLKLFNETIDKYYEDAAFLKFKLRMGLLCQKGLYNYEFEIDGSAKRFSVLLSPSINDIDYDHMNSLNATLPLMPTMTRPSIFIIDYERIKESPVMTKFIYCCLLEDKVDLKRIRINVDDFDDWEFDYTLNSKNK